MKKKSIGLCIFLSIITLGFYGLFWLIDILTETDEYFPDDEQYSPVWKMILSIVTAGIYGIFWWSRIGEYLHKADSEHIDNKSTAFLMIRLFIFIIETVAFSTHILKVFNDPKVITGILLGIDFTLYFTMMALTQNDLNKINQKKKKKA